MGTLYCRCFAALLGPVLAYYCLLLPGSAGSPADPCPRKIDCTLLKRTFCSPGSTKCGSCIQGYVETTDGTCQITTNLDKVASKKMAEADLEREIDYLASIANKQPHDLQLAQGDNNTPSQSPPLLSAPPYRSSERYKTPIDNSSAPSKVPRKNTKEPLNDALLLGVVVSCAVAGLMALIVAGVCWCRMHREIKLAEKTDYASFRTSPPPPYEKTSPGDKKLAQSAQMYHYQHQKQQMISMEKNKDEPKHPDSAVTSDEENEDGDFTVYECPGLAPTGEMEVKNPLFDDSSLHHSVHNAP
ncbi:neural proliferation differentiation and control protein 1 [Bombina bombina]|uniref:neural proliferation differentiation and control protein 1 n=1 Tax=Bombina bombina TaxID=8345 RepID=UPI00235AE2FD|nr:neural proliferation differentiation and control protein 1 [Bombina bombina]